MSQVPRAGTPKVGVKGAAEWASYWDGLERCPHTPPHDNEKEYLSAVAYDACLAECFAAYARQQVAEMLEPVAQRVKTLENALRAITRRVPIMASTDDYRAGQLHALEACSAIAQSALTGEERE
mgnify:CR=1 FL=1